MNAKASEKIWEKHFTLNIGNQINSDLKIAFSEILKRYKWTIRDKKNIYKYEQNTNHID